MNMMTDSESDLDYSWGFRKHDDDEHDDEVYDDDDDEYDDEGYDHQ